MMAGAISLKNPMKGIMISVALLPWYGISIDLGLAVTGYLLFWIPSMLVVTIQCSRRAAQRHFIGSIFIVWATSWSLFQIIFLPQDVFVQGGILRSPQFRAFFQIILFLLALSPIWVIPIVVSKAQHIYVLARTYIVSTVFLCLLGWLQIIIWNVAGVDILPVGIVNSLFGGLQSEYLGHPGAVFRMTSLGGEPQHLGASILVAILILQMKYLYSGLSRQLKYVYVFLLLSMYQTYSSVALFLYLAITLVTIWITLKPTHFKIHNFHSRRRQLIAYMMVVVSVFSIVAIVGPSNDSETRSFLDTIYDRTWGRITSETGQERYYQDDFDAPVIDFLLDHPETIPTGVGMGNIHLYVNDYLPKDVAVYAANTALVAKRGYLRLISELGLVGFLLLFLWFYAEYRNIYRLAYLPDPIGPLVLSVSSFCLCMLVAYMGACLLIIHYYMAFGVMRSIPSLAKDSDTLGACPSLVVTNYKH